MKRNLLFFGMFLCTGWIWGQNCNLTETTSYTGAYNMEQVTPGIFGYDTFLDGLNTTFQLFSEETDAGQTSPGITLADNERSFDADYIASLGFGNTRTYIMSFDSCGVTFSADETTGLQCAGDGVLLGPTAGGDFDANDDNEFTLIFIDDVTDDCSQGSPTVEIRFTKTAEIQCVDDIAVVNDPADNDCSEQINFADILAFDIDGAPLTVTQVEGLPNGSDFPVGETLQIYTATSLVNGQVSTCVFTVTVEDIVDPTATCPPDVTVDLGSDLSGPLPDYTLDATISDNCDVDPSVTQDPIPGTTINNGSTITVTITARDESFNTGTCTFEVTFESDLGVEDPQLAKIALYPNPATDYITIANPEGALLETAEIMDMQGRVVQTTDLSNASADQKVDVQGYASGLYFIRISSETGSIIKRFVKN